MSLFKKIRPLIGFCALPRPGSRNAERFRHLAKGVLVPMICLGLVNCRHGPPNVPTPADGLTIIKEFWNQHAEIADTFVTAKVNDKAELAIEVDMDYTLSMAGYVRGAKEPGSAFFKLLRQFANQGELTGFNAFGTNDKDPNLLVENLTPLGTAPPLDVSKYDRKNNDYAGVIRVISDSGRQKFSDGKPIQHLIVTDGVQSNKDTGHNSALTNTVKELQSWIQKGGAVEFRLGTTPFDGRYYSEDLRILKEIDVEQNTQSKQKDRTSGDSSVATSFEGKTKARPFLVIGLISDRGLLPAWKKFWDHCPAVEFQKIAMFPPVAARLKTVKITPLPTVSKKEFYPDLLFEDVWKLKPIKGPEDTQNLYSAHITNFGTKKSRMPSDYPVCFQVSGLTGTLSEQFQSFLNLHPVLRAWTQARPDPKPGLNPKPKAQKGPATLIQVANPVEWRPNPPLELPDVVDVEKFAKLTEEGFELMLRLPLPSADGSVAIVTMEVEQPKSQEPGPDFSEFSCGDDYKPDTLDRIYNLDPLVKQLAKEIVQPIKHTGCLIVTHR